MTAGSRQETSRFTRLKPHHRTPNLTGERFGFLEVIGYAGGDGKKSWWTARCDCGTKRLFVGSELRKGSVRSCGCQKASLLSEAAKTHGMSRHRAYGVWRNMMDRCRLPSHFAYERYGGRGISVCERWSQFENFWADMGPTWRQGLTIERKNNDEGYNPENCVWADRRAQARNTRSNTYIRTPLGRMLICEAAELSGLNVTTLCYRAGAGWPAKHMFDPPDTSRKIMS